MGSVATQIPKTKALAAFVFVVLLGIAVFCLWEWPSWKAAKNTQEALATGRYSDAARITRLWIRQQPYSAEARFLHAKASIVVGSRDEVLDGMKQARALGYPEQKIATLRALLDAQAGRFELARPILTKAFTETSEPDPLVAEALARVLMDTYEWLKAEQVLTKWTNDAPKDARPPLWHAVVKLRRASWCGHFDQGSKAPSASRGRNSHTARR